ncbi:hypothetical protein DPMN_117628 [Dreissena polymorpha]|uniref:Uncharacterized protein n=1 Tax=Dreissena polymorpha TaxID=45954 RepID=A0A9D4GJC4_DREPO|nr:hypothetical protein DPMN_117628 [Dreissena polymorpha]
MLSTSSKLDLDCYGCVGLEYLALPLLMVRPSLAELSATMFKTRDVFVRNTMPPNAPL